MAKFLTVIAGIPHLLSAITSSGGNGSADRVVATGPNGKLDSSLLPPEVAITTESREATEGLSAGTFVNEYDDAGVTKVRLADLTNSRPATGFVTTAYTIGQTATILPLGQNNDALIGLIPGLQYFASLDNPGGIMTGLQLDAALSTGDSIQSLGLATSTTVLETGKYPIVYNGV